MLRSHQLPRQVWRAIHGLRRLLPNHARDQALTRQADMVILDFSYARGSGHHHALNQLLLRTARQTGLKARVYASRYIPSQLVSADVRPTFRAGVYDRVDDAGQWRAKHARIVRQTRFDLELAELQALKREAIIVVHTATASHIQALVDVLAKHRCDQRVNVFLMLPPSFDVPADLTEMQASAYVAAAEAGRRAGLRIQYWCENTLLLQDYARRGIQGIEQADLPALMPATEPKPGGPTTMLRGSEPAHRTTWLFIGEPRGDKGFELLWAALPLIKAKGLNVTIRLRLTKLTPAQEQGIAAAHDGQTVDFKAQEFFTDEAYFADMASADGVLLPYDPIDYALKNSNIVSESLGCGTPVIVPPGVNSLTAYCRQHALGAYVEMASYTPQGLLAAIEQGYARISALRSASQAVAAAIRQRRDPVSFLRRMIGQSS